jgi:hypothetical protein
MWPVEPRQRFACPDPDCPVQTWTERLHPTVPSVTRPTSTSRLIPTSTGGRND